MSEPNVLLDALIEAAGFSHAGFADRVNKLGCQRGLDLHYDHASVARWVRDHAVPRGRVPEIACEVLGAGIGRPISFSEAGFEHLGNQRAADVPLFEAVDRAAATWRSAVKRGLTADIQPAQSGPAAVSPVFEWENPPDDVDVSRRSGCRTVAVGQILMIQEARERYEQMYRRVGGIPVWPRAVGFLDSQVAPLLRDNYDDAVGRQLMRACGGLVAVAGICLYDADRQAVAQRYFFDALRLAKASGDRGFGGYIVALLANQSMSLARYRQVVQYAETAVRGAGNCLGPALVSDLCTLQARAYARMGDRGRCHEQMRRAERMAERIRRSEEPPETGYVQPGLVEVQHAEALRQLGDLAPAQVYAEEALASVETSHMRGQVHRFATLAMVLAERGQVDTAAGVAHHMLDRVQGMESRRLRDRVQSVASAIQAGGDGVAARELAERARDQLATPIYS